MKKQLLFLLTLISGFYSYSQISFEKGYFINNSNQKIECFIKNVDWQYNPSDFEYKLSENDKIQKATIRTIQEFGIYDISKYIRNTVKIDRSSKNINELTEDRNPTLIEEQLFLQAVIEGKANLYVYEDGNLKRYFYNNDETAIEQLIFKKYKTSSNAIGKNNRFRQQLLNDLECSTIKMKTIENLKYTESSLIHFFTEYNQCSNSDFISYEGEQEKDLFNVTFRARVNNASLKAQNDTSSFRNTDFGPEVSLGFGIEAEFILPFNKKKWGILLEPTYQRFTSEKTIDEDNLVGGKLKTEVAYSSIEFSAGLRHYFFLNNNAKLFINVSYIYDFDSKSTIEYKRADGSIVSFLDIETNNNYSFGLGFKYRDTYSLEMRYQTSRDVLGGYSYNSASIIVGYSIF